jgi:hypothetical protein
MNLKEIARTSLDWFYLDKDSDQWRVLMKLVMDFRVSIKGIESSER